VNAERVVLGLVPREALEADANALIADVMQPSPVTFRPHVEAGKLPEYVKSQRISRALVTTSDGVLVGLLRLS
jgi:Mg/Co/Ni transporter MgtE